MNRFHVHMSVDNLQKNIAFYSALFNASPTVLEIDYAKWMLDDPHINFAISARGAKAGIDHLGIQVELADDLDALKTRYDAADASSVISEPGSNCCYARSDKHWITDPQGIAWEAYHTLGSIPTFNNANLIDSSTTPADAACCSPRSAEIPRGKPLSIPVKNASSSCC